MDDGKRKTLLTDAAWNLFCHLQDSLWNVMEHTKAIAEERYDSSITEAFNKLYADPKNRRKP